MFKTNEYWFPYHDEQNEKWICIWHMKVTYEVKHYNTRGISIPSHIIQAVRGCDTTSAIKARERWIWAALPLLWKSSTTSHNASSAHSTVLMRLLKLVLATPLVSSVRSAPPHDRLFKLLYIIKSFVLMTYQRETGLCEPLTPKLGLRLMFWSLNCTPVLLKCHSILDQNKIKCF